MEPSRTPGAAEAVVPGFLQVQREVPWLEPAHAYARVRSAGQTPFLLDGLGAHPEARYAFLALTPVQEVRVEGPYTTDKGEGHATETRGNVLGHLRQVLGDTRFPVVQEAPFTGGWVGAIAYEFARNFEPTLPPRKEGTGVPDAVLVLCLDAVVFDRQARTARLFCADLNGDRSAAEARAARITADLARDAVLPRWEPTEETRFETSLSADQFVLAVAQLRRLIQNGDLFQANLATRFEAPCVADPLALFLRLQDSNPSPYMALLEFDGFSLVSASPEQLVAVEHGVVRSRPIAGTRKRGPTAPEDLAMEGDLLADPKEQAEHTMLVDLLRNDLARVSRPGTVRVPERMSVERYRHVMHLVSRVEGDLRSGADVLDVLAAVFPGGTITGAPKHRACQRIHEAEPVPRGYYTGSAGYVAWNGDTHWNILIRTLVLEGGAVSVHAGSGIVADSDPEREWKEANRKARALLEAVQGRDTGGGNRTRLGEVSEHGSWAPPKATSQVHGKRVLLIDNYDSFVHNLADYCAAAGAEVQVVRNDADWRAAVAAFRPTHLVLSPGPGWPDEAGSTLEIARDMTGKLPILGVCLGHQAIGQAHGGTVTVHPAGPVHGRPDDVLHEGKGLFAGLPSPLRATRYHSLVVDPGTLGDDWLVDAWLADGTVMALRHRSHPTFGVQFHPESLCTDRGLDLVVRFLQVTA
ncbi:MAG: chorismate-binding protein [Candidatus Thermoplasmatota archaeon]